MRIVFMGSGAIGCPTLAMLRGRRDDVLAAVVTQPDRPQGRHLRCAPCPAKDLAARRGVPVLSPGDVNSAASLEDLRGRRPDIVVVAAFGQILRRGLLELPPLGCVNLHASLLPSYRGAAPIQWALANGERATGVTSMWMNARMDAGDVILQREVAIRDDDTAGSLQERLAAEGAALMDETLDLIGKGAAPRRPQAEDRATYAPRLRKEDGRIDWSLSARAIYNRIRGFNPWPCCRARLPAERGGGMLRILRARVEPAAAAGAGAAAPGRVLEAGGDGPLVAAGEPTTGVRLTEVQPEGRRVMTGRDYLHGHGLRTGDVLG
ncbi:MAG: methionyl-tRNA formyltransferase [Lentisphaerae bacterium]|nr:methionyl-tRNA formyltransferase [Lentisphaerota bacterium]